LFASARRNLRSCSLPPSRHPYQHVGLLVQRAGCDRLALLYEVCAACASQWKFADDGPRPSLFWGGTPRSLSSTCLTARGGDDSAPPPQQSAERHPGLDDANCVSRSSRRAGAKQPSGEGSLPPSWIGGGIRDAPPHPHLINTTSRSHCLHKPTLALSLSYVSLRTSLHPAHFGFCSLKTRRSTPRRR